MNKYGEAARQSVLLVESGAEADPVQAWVQSTKKIFPSSANLQNKGCPKGAFLGLCNEGMVKGIPPGIYSNTSKNGKYALDAVKLLQSNKFLVSQPDMLWKKVAGNTISHNHQMDVVIGLWESNYIQGVTEMSEQEVEQLDNTLKAIGEQFDSLRDVLDRIATWPDSEHKQKCFDSIFAHQDTLIKWTEEIGNRLEALGAPKR